MFAKISLKANSLFLLVLFILLFLTYGLISTYGNTYTFQLLYFIIPFIVVYFGFNKFFLKRKIDLSKTFFTDNQLDFLLNFLILFVLAFQIIHFYFIGNIPFIKAILTSDYYYIAQIRQDIKLVESVLVNYGASLILKALLPMVMLVLYFRDKKRFWVFTIIAIFYALALMQKGYVATIFLPLILKLSFLKQWLHAFYLFVIVCLGIVFLVYITNPPIRPFGWNKCFVENEEVKAEVAEVAEVGGGVFDALFDRVFVTTGKMVGHWFNFIPDSLPFLNGQGYRFAIPFIGGVYHDYSREVYDKVYLKEAAMGFTGTATTAFFMYDYANFGKYGLVLSGLYLGIFLVLLKRFFSDDYINLFALNGLFIIWLSSASFTSTIFSGGWLFILLLYFIFKPFIKVDKKL